VPRVVDKVDQCFERDLVGIGDLVYCEIMRASAPPVSATRSPPSCYRCRNSTWVGFNIAEQSAANYRLLRSKGVTVRKTIDVLIGTFCAENGHRIVHSDSDFDLMAEHIGLDVL
jgi:predicted nucleic acid-binding protein